MTQPAPAFDAVVSLGSNIGDKAGNIAHAIEILTSDGAVELAARSSDYRTPPWGNTEQDWLKTNLARFTGMLQGQRDLNAVGQLLLTELVPLSTFSLETRV